MPLGLDAPTSIGMALLVLGPSFVAFKQQGMDEQAAADRDLATRHGVADRDGHVEAGAVVLRRCHHPRGAARGTARFDRRRGTGAARAFCR